MDSILDRFYKFALNHLIGAGANVQVVFHAFVEENRIHVKEAERLAALLKEQGVVGVNAPERSNRIEPAFSPSQEEVEAGETVPPQVLPTGEGE